MSRELEALERLKTYFKNNCVNDWEYNDDFKYKDDLDIIDSVLKAFEIIKRELKYNVDFENAKLTAHIDGMIQCENKEEFDLLKEVLQ